MWRCPRLCWADGGGVGSSPSGDSTPPGSAGDWTPSQTREWEITLIFLAGSAPPLATTPRPSPGWGHQGFTHLTLVFVTFYCNTTHTLLSYLLECEFLKDREYPISFPFSNTQYKT